MVNFDTSFFAQLDYEAVDYEICRCVQKIDEVSKDYEARWGVERLPELVSHQTKNKWDTQWKKLQNAIDQKNLHDVATQTMGCIRAWDFLEKEAIKNGHKQKAPDYYEARHPDSGNVYRICTNNNNASQSFEKNVYVYTMEEVVRILESSHFINKTKKLFQGAKLTSIEKAEYNYEDDISDI